VSRNAKLVLAFAVLAVVCGGAACFAAVQIAPALVGLSCEPSQTPSVSPVYTDTTTVARLFPKLGAFQEAHWQTREARPRTCPDIGPMDYVKEGVVTLLPETAQQYREGYLWSFETPEIPPALAGFAPAGARWSHSQQFDAMIGTGRFYVDPVSPALFFVHHTT